jgi:hypothetical protein
MTTYRAKTWHTHVRQHMTHMPANTCSQLEQEVRNRIAAASNQVVEVSQQPGGRGESATGV